MLISYQEAFSTENQRIRLSKKMLKEALIQLLQNKAIEKITIYELCDTAQINRTTFYKYYGNQYDLLDEIENDFFNELEEYLTTDQPEDLNCLRRILENLEREQAKCKVLINSVPDLEFSEKLFSLPSIQSFIKYHTPQHYTLSQAEYFRLFFCQGGYAIIRKWLNKESRESPEEIASMLSDFYALLRKK